MSFKKFTKGFTQIPNDILNDPNLTFKAKGLWAFLNSKPEGWDFSQERIATQTKEGDKSVKSGLKELVNAGYLFYVPKKNKKGQVCGQEYHFFDEPQVKTIVGTILGGTVNGGDKVIKSNSNKEISDRVMENEFPTLRDRYEKSEDSIKNQGISILGFNGKKLIVWFNNVCVQAGEEAGWTLPPINIDYLVEAEKATFNTLVKKRGLYQLRNYELLVYFLKSNFCSDKFYQMKNGVNKNRHGIILTIFSLWVLNGMPDSIEELQEKLAYS